MATAALPHKPALPLGLPLAAAAVAIPAIAFAWLLGHPASDASVRVPFEHFVVVTIVSMLAFAIAILLAIAAMQIAQYRVLFLCLGFMAMGGIFAVHGLETPGILGDTGDVVYAGQIVGISAYLSLFIAALFFAASYTPITGAFERRLPFSPAVAIRGAAANRNRVDDAITAVNGLAYADRPIGRLSGGEQQRLLLAQALAGEPKMLLLDEPLASLDLRNQIVIAELVARIARENGLTVLLIAHDINPLLPVVDRVLYVAHGGVAIGKPADVITSDQLSRLYNAPVEVLHDSHGHMFVVGLEAESAHHEEITP